MKAFSFCIRHERQNKRCIPAATARYKRLSAMLSDGHAAKEEAGEGGKGEANKKKKKNVRLNHRLRNITLIITQTNKHKFLFFLSLSCCLCPMPSPHFSRHCRAIGF